MSEGPVPPHFRSTIGNVPELPSWVLGQHRARILRGEETDLPPEAGPLPPVAYRFEYLLVPWELLDPRVEIDGFASELFRKLLDAAADAEGLVWEQPASTVLAAEFRGALREALREGDLLHMALPVRLFRREGEPPRGPIDAWRVLRMLRHLAGIARDHPDALVAAAARVSLDHLLVGSVVIEGLPSGATEGHGGEDADAPGGRSATGRRPVTLRCPAPPRRNLPGPRRVVVAVLDTGVGQHGWLDTLEAEHPAGRVGATGSDDFAVSDLTFLDQSAGPTPPLPDPEAIGVGLDALTGRLDPYAGHGTFIAGLVRQVAPDTRVLALRVMHGDGIVYEQDLLRALGVIGLRNHWAQIGRLPAENFVDVVSLSMGCLYEGSADQAYMGVLGEQVRQIVDAGVAVVASAGNSASSIPVYPAAFCLDDELRTVLSVGGLTPAEDAQAMFSNDGAWVNAWAPAVDVVSTFPVTFQAALGPATSVEVAGSSGPPRRQSRDFDDFGGGFGIWQGTSFAAPQIAAEVARELAAYEDIGTVRPESARTRRDAVVAAVRSSWPTTHEDGPR